MKALDPLPSAARKLSKVEAVLEQAVHGVLRERIASAVAGGAIALGI